MSALPTRTVLLVAFHYPPCAISSGVQRTLSLAAHLHEHGWRPVVLTVHEGAYERVSVGRVADLPAEVPVIRTRALDAARHLAIRGRYWSRLALPDRWMSWRLTAVPRGLQILRHQRIDAIWSTYPIATAHLIAASLARRSRVPWIADFRDPMVERDAETGELYPGSPPLRRSRLRVEAQAVRDASALVFCTGAARRIVLDRYPELGEGRTHVISNGYHEQAFRGAELLPPPLRTGGRRVLLHSGTIYPGADRDPTALFHALKGLWQQGLVSPQNVEVRLRDPSKEEYFRSLAAQVGVLPLISILPRLPYREALAEMLAADGLLLLQGHTSNPAIPAKLYEYLRAGRPILALVDPAGETAAALRSAGISTLARLTDADEIAALLSRWARDPQSMEGARAQPQYVAGYSRERLAGNLADLLDRLVAGRAAGPSS